MALLVAQPLAVPSLSQKAPTGNPITPRVRPIYRRSKYAAATPVIVLRDLLICRGLLLLFDLLQGGDQATHILVASDAAEALLGLEHGGARPVVCQKSAELKCQRLPLLRAAWDERPQLK